MNVQTPSEKGQGRCVAPSLCACLRYAIHQGRETHHREEQTQDIKALLFSYVLIVQAYQAP